MTRTEVRDRIREVGILPAVRTSSSEDAKFAAEAVCRGGISVVEITLTVPGAIPLISHLIKHHPKLVVGAGTVLDAETARQCAEAGAHFLTSPGMVLKVVDFANLHQIAVLPGAMTPSEVIAAWQAGCDFVKIFPCAQVGGEAFIKALKAPFPQIPLIASGGVNQQTASNFILAGATVIGVGAELIPVEAIARRQSKRIQELAGRFLGFVKEARERLAGTSEGTAPQN
jgi:2-dehydro-3-deoxyphosphogluconate aldolase / (4S)-4-hydroxy-2-oxoglutarate aldolase